MHCFVFGVKQTNQPKASEPSNHNQFGDPAQLLLKILFTLLRLYWMVKCNIDWASSNLFVKKPQPVMQMWN